MDNDVEDVSLEEVVLAGIDDRLLDVHTALPGKVQKYDRARNSVDVILQCHRLLPTDDDDYVAKPFAVVPDVPVCFPSAGGMIFTLPVKKGDYCLVVFSESSLAAWRQRGEAVDPGDPARHHISGAMAIMGLRPISKVIDAHADHLIIGKEGVEAAQIEITDTEVHLGAGADKFIALADKVDTELNKIASTLGSVAGGSGSPVTFGSPYTRVVGANVASTNAKAKG